MSTLYAIGIDFGTSNSCVTYASYYRDERGRLQPEPVHRPDVITFQLRDTIPTAVFRPHGEGQPCLFGELAEEKAVFFPDMTFTGFKLALGRPDEDGQQAFGLAKEFFAYLRTRVSDYVPFDGAGNCRVETIVGHPVQWSTDQREETRRAAREAGFPNVQLEDESLAALYACLCEDRGSFDPQPGNQILMVDMGGGTTDFAFLQLPTTPGQRPISTPVDPAGVIAPWGSGQITYGGRDLDDLILAYLSRDWDPSCVARQRAQLMRDVRRLKEAFSTHVREGEEGYETQWVVGGEPVRVGLRRSEFEEFAGDYIAHFEALVRGALEMAELTPSQISSVILTGGHSRWYFVDDTLCRIFPHISRELFTLVRHTRPEQVVARGLAYLPMVRASGAKILAPVRKAAHSLWVGVPTGMECDGATRLSRDGATPGSAYRHRPAQESAASDAPSPRRGKRGGRSQYPSSNGGDTDHLLIARGQTLPYLTPRPLRIWVNQLGLDAKEASVRIRFYSSSGGTRRQQLHERVARFERDFWEGLWKRLGSCLPWLGDARQDEFELKVLCYIDENELLTAELVITRYFRGKEVAVQRQKLCIDSGSSRREAAALPAASSVRS
jgi:hypothetical protein